MSYQKDQEIQRERIHIYIEDNLRKKKAEYEYFIVRQNELGVTLSFIDKKKVDQIFNEETKGFLIIDNEVVFVSEEDVVKKKIERVLTLNFDPKQVKACKNKFLAVIARKPTRIKVKEDLDKLL